MIGSVSCPAFGDELVFFNKHGFIHLIRKEGKRRSLNQQVRRLGLFDRAAPILSSAKEFSRYEIRDDMTSKAYFWTFLGKDEFSGIKVVVRQLEGGRKHFFSIMDHT